MPEEVLDKCSTEMAKAKIAFEKELASIRTGRANPAFLDSVKVDVYGSIMPISSVGSVSVMDSKTLVVSVWDSSNINSVDSAIRKSDLGLNPKVEGDKLFINLPELTEDRRKEFIKIVRKKTEDIKIRIRNVRRDINEDYKKLEKEKLLSEDELKSYLDKVQKITDENISNIDDMLKNKEKELISL